MQQGFVIYNERINKRIMIRYRHEIKVSNAENVQLEALTRNKALIKAGNYMFKVNSRKTRTRFEICLK